VKYYQQKEKHDCLSVFFCIFIVEMKCFFYSTTVVSPSGVVTDIDGNMRPKTLKKNEIQYLNQYAYTS